MTIQLNGGSRRRPELEPRGALPAADSYDGDAAGEQLSTWNAAYTPGRTCSSVGGGWWTTWAVYVGGPMETALRR